MKKKSNLQKIAQLNQQQLINLARPYYTDEKWQHIKQVLKQAQGIKQKPLSNVQKAIIYMHDTQKKRMGNKGHQKAGAILARKLLRGKYDKATLKRIYNAIQQHSPDYRLSIKNFQHSSPQAQLLAIADDSNNIRRDPQLTSMYTIKYTKGEFKDKDSPQRSFLRHKQFFGPLLGHPNLKYYKDRWKEYAKQGIKNIQNYPFQKYKVLYSLVNKDTQLPDIDLLTKKL